MNDVRVESVRQAKKAIAWPFNLGISITGGQAASVEDVERNDRIPSDAKQMPSRTEAQTPRTMKVHIPIHPEHADKAAG